MCVQLRESAEWPEYLGESVFIPICMKGNNVQNAIFFRCSAYQFHLWLWYILVRLYIGCDTCSRWFHGSCVGVSTSDLQLMTAYVCPECRKRTVSHLDKCWVASSHLLKHLEVCYRQHECSIYTSI